MPFSASGQPVALAPFNKISESELTLNVSSFPGLLLRLGQINMRFFADSEAELMETIWFIPTSS